MKLKLVTATVWNILFFSSLSSGAVVDVDAPSKFTPATIPSSLKVDALVFDSKKKLLQLNISWIPNKESPQATGYNIHVWPLNDTNPSCESEPYYGFLEDSEAYSWVVPPLSAVEVLHDTHFLTVTPECSYQIKLEANPYDGKSHLEVIFKVPECVADICSCLHPESLPKLEIQIQHLTRETINITWSLNNTSNVSLFILRAGPKLADGAHSSLFNLSWSREVLAYPGQTVYSELYSAAVAGQYTVALQTVDPRHCPSPEHHHLFTVIGDLKSDEVSSTIKRLWLLLLPTLVILTSCLLMILFGQKCFFWFENKRRDTTLVGSAYFYKAIRIKSEKVFRRSDSLQERNILYVEKEIEEAKATGQADEYEVCSKRLTFQREIGRGAFGQVFLAKAEAIRGVPGSQLVAVKKLKEDAGLEEKEEFLEEIWMLKKAGQHPNIVSLLACCTLQSNICMVMEYVPCGDLLQYLRNLRRQLDARRSLTSMSDGMYSASSTVMTSLYSQTSSSPLPDECCDLNYMLDHTELHDFALQIARGMAHLEAKRITHRDLAARNILIDCNKVLKISDFGLSRRGVYVNTRRRKVPLRWLSIEAMRDSLYSSKSDVWAFAILLWEIGTLGGFPYPTVADNDLLTFLQCGKRLEKPIIVSNSLYSVMIICWSEKPDDRFSFAELVSYLEPDPDRHVYVNFDSNLQLPPPSPDCIFQENPKDLFR